MPGKQDSKGRGTSHHRVHHCRTHHRRTHCCRKDCHKTGEMMEHDCRSLNQWKGRTTNPKHRKPKPSH